MFRVERYHDICCGHRIVGHEGKCAWLHGHNYRITFQLQSKYVNDMGIVIDFSEMKQIFCDWLDKEFDHRFLVWDKDPLLPQLQEICDGIRVVPFNPTAENLAKYLVEEFNPPLLEIKGLILKQVTVEETNKCRATYIHTK